MAEAVETQPEISPNVVETQPEVTSKEDNDCKEDASSMDVEISSDTSNTKTNHSDKREYSEEEKQKRREYFKKIKNSRKLAREKYNKNLLKRLGVQPFVRRGEVQLSKSILSRNMSDDEQKMLDFYKVRLSTLRSENETLHKRLAYLVNENMRFLQVFISIFNYNWFILKWLSISMFLQ